MINVVNNANSRYSNFGSSCGLFVSKSVCEARIGAGLNPDGSNPSDAEADLLLAQAMLEAQRKDEQKDWTAMQTTGVVFASLLGITLLVVVIKKVKRK